jgi:hypothetical protein
MLKNLQISRLYIFFQIYIASFLLENSEYLGIGLRDFSRDANAPEPGFEPEPKPRNFGKFSNPVPEPKAEFEFLRARNPNRPPFCSGFSSLDFSS